MIWLEDIFAFCVSPNAPFSWDHSDIPSFSGWDWKTPSASLAPGLQGGGSYSTMDPPDGFPWDERDIFTKKRNGWVLYGEYVGKYNIHGSEGL